MTLSNAARRAIAIRHNVARKAAAAPANDVSPSTSMHPGLLAMCVEAGGFEQNQRFA